MSIIIVGAGLSGLTIAYQLQKMGVACKVIESQDRIGGRIMTISGHDKTPMELGATWFAEYHHNLIALLDELNIGYFPQHSEGIAIIHTRSVEPPQQFYVPASGQVSYRIKGGSSALIHALVSALMAENITLSTTIKHVQQVGDKKILTDQKGHRYEADMVIVALPPQLIGNIHFSPSLPHELMGLLPKVHTWMSGSIKFAVEYDKPFWRENGFSGTIYCHTGLAVEVYDQSNFEENRFALVGFLNPGAATYSLHEREKMVIAQVNMLFDGIATNHVSYTDKIWNDEYIKSPTEIILQAHQNNGHPLLRKSYYDNTLFFAGTETSPHYPGYMEGAIYSANELIKQIAAIGT